MPRMIYNYSGTRFSLIYGILLAMELLSKISLLDVSLFFFFPLHRKKIWARRKDDINLGTVELSLSYQNKSEDINQFYCMENGKSISPERLH